MTKQESNLKIIQLLAEGKVQKEIATDLGMTLDAVRCRILEMKKKTKSPTQTALVVKVIKENILTFAGLP
jgi:DNA-binding NarL/FixJ family response regulator